jgi:hypothetical protein
MYKVWILAYGETTWATNALEFETIKEARVYADELLSRWLGAKEYAILPVNDLFKGSLDHEVVLANQISDEK